MVVAGLRRCRCVVHSSRRRRSNGHKRATSSFAILHDHQVTTNNALTTVVSPLVTSFTCRFLACWQANCVDSVSLYAAWTKSAPHSVSHAIRLKRPGCGGTDELGLCANERLAYWCDSMGRHEHIPHSCTRRNALCSRITHSSRVQCKSVVRTTT